MGRKQLYAYPAHFSQLGEHNNNGGVVFPEHSPEVLCGLCQGSLRGNIGFLLPVGTQSHDGKGVIISKCIRTKTQ